MRTEVDSYRIKERERERMRGRDFVGTGATNGGI